MAMAEAAEVTGIFLFIYYTNVLLGSLNRSKWWKQQQQLVTFASWDTEFFFFTFFFLYAMFILGAMNMLKQWWQQQQQTLVGFFPFIIFFITNDPASPTGMFSLSSLPSAALKMFEAFQGVTFRGVELPSSLGTVSTEG